MGKRYDFKVAVAAGNTLAEEVGFIVSPVAKLYWDGLVNEV